MKLKPYETLIQPIFTYWSEAWTMVREGMNVLRLFETIKGKYTDPYIKENAKIRNKQGNRGHTTRKR